MYSGKNVAQGDTIFVFASETQVGHRLLTRGVVTSAEAVPEKCGIARQTPRVSITVRRTVFGERSPGRRKLKPFSDWKDGQPEIGLN